MRLPSNQHVEFLSFPKWLKVINVAGGKAQFYSEKLCAFSLVPSQLKLKTFNIYSDKEELCDMTR